MDEAEEERSDLRPQIGVWGRQAQDDRKLEADEPDEDFYDAKVKVLKEQVEHHVDE